jgi:hypothetical protein
LGDNGLTECGRRQLDAVNEEANRLLRQFHKSNGMNLIDASVEKYAWRELKDSELGEIEDDCGYLVSLRKLRDANDRQPRHQQIERPLFSGVLMPWETEHGPAESVGGGVTMSFSMRLRAQNPTVSMVHVPRAIELAATAQCMRLLREAENNVRGRLGLPRIGEGWVSETELFNLICGAFPGAKVVQHARPEWLSPQHVDVYLPDFGIGIEYQGAQHLEPVDYFGGEKAFAQQKRRDARKRRLCHQNRCLLVEVFQGYDAKLEVAKIQGMMAAGTGLHCNGDARADTVS